jgi:NADPH2:quinone reductase
MGVTSFYTGNGSYAEYCLAPEFSLYPLGEDMGDADAAAFGISYHTAWVGLKLRARIEKGETVLVHGGAGGSGSTAIQLAKALGATVIATASSDAKLEYCKAQGADHVINYQQADFVAKVLSLTEGRGVDIVYDPVGGEVFEKSVSCCASGGRLLAIGFACGRGGNADTQQLVARNVAVLGVYVGAHSHDEMLDTHQQLLELHSAGAITVPVSSRVPFDQVAASLGKLDRREVQGKLVVSIA